MDVCGPHRRPILLAAAVAGALLVIAAAVLLALSPWSDDSPAATPTPAVTPPTPAPVQTETPTITPSPQPAPVGTPAAGAYGPVPDLPGVGFEAMVDMAIVPGSDGREAVIITQTGLLYRIFLSGDFEPAPWGDVSGRLSYGGEEGLLSIAFSPRFTSDGRVYLYYTTGSPGPSVLSRFLATASELDAGSEERLLEIGQPFSNHNGGRILFGPDGYLYLSLGDGGSGGDPLGHGQNVNTLLGAVLRLDVSPDSGYSIPGDNPFAGAGGLDEIYAYGLRNPWRFSFDRETGDLWLADVGQNRWEEVQRVLKGGNYGWNCYEGFEEFAPQRCNVEELQFPRAVYPLTEGNCAATGGYVYRGQAMPELGGWYVYADHCSGRVWAVDTSGESSDPVLLADTDLTISSFAELPDGELLMLTFDRAVFRLARQ